MMYWKESICTIYLLQFMEYSLLDIVTGFWWAFPIDYIPWTDVAGRFCKLQKHH